jgi:dTDP-4-dehydrorhamnose reductase
MKILVFGITGMLGSAVFRSLSNDKELEVFGTIRQSEQIKHFSAAQTKHILPGVNAENYECLINAFTQVRPDVVINCIGLIKHVSDGNNPLRAIAINAQLPHQLSQLCKLTNSRLVHISTDCVFSGTKGFYTENDLPDAKDVYGRSKLLGEVHEAHALTIRTSIIGHEISSNRSLLEWFLSQQSEVKGFNKAIFSGLTAVELSKVIKDVILIHQHLSGLYHVAATPINKFELLHLVAKTYNKQINIIQDESFVIDRSLDATLFNSVTGYKPPQWPALIQRMHQSSFECMA